MSRKASSKRQTKAQKAQLEIMENNVIAINKGPKKKSWSVLDIKNVRPMTEAQRAMIESYYMGNHIVATGSSGTGKTYLAMWLALNTILSQETQQDKIILVRSAVPSREIGFNKGTIEEKVAVYETPYYDMLEDLLGKTSSYEDLKDAGKIRFMPTSFVRGSTWDNAIIILEEAQNFTAQEIHSCATRVGRNSRVIVCADLAQNDLHSKKGSEQSGYADFLKIADKMPEFDVITFTPNDIVRSGFVKSWIMIKESLGL